MGRSPLRAFVASAWILALVGAGLCLAGSERLKAKPVRAALQARYTQIVEAYRLRDPDAVLRLRAKDFRAIMPSGQIWDSATSAAYVR